MDRKTLILKEIKNQAIILREFFNKFKSRYWNKLDTGNVILTGCGDSYAAAMILNQLKKVEIKDPYELYYERLNRSKFLIIISVSGRTIANIKLAERAKREGLKTYVITGNPKSKLAQIADEIIDIEYQEPTVLPGTLSFTKTLIALYVLFGIDLDFESLNEKKIEDFFKEFGSLNGESFFIVTSPGYFPLSYYWKAKILEMTGSKVMIERCEQFLHMDLFAVNRKDCVILIGKEDSRCQQLYEYIKNKLSFCKYVKLSDDYPSGFLEGSIAGQIFAYNIMQNKGLKDVYFASSEMLEISDKMIY